MVKLRQTTLLHQPRTSHMIEAATCIKTLFTAQHCSQGAVQHCSQGAAQHCSRGAAQHCSQGATQHCSRGAT